MSSIAKRPNDQWRIPLPRCGDRRLSGVPVCPPLTDLLTFVLQRHRARTTHGGRPGHPLIAPDSHVDKIEELTSGCSLPEGPLA
jgi:hypothetical protein